MITILYVLAAIVGLIIVWRVSLTIWYGTAKTTHEVKLLALERQAKRQVLDMARVVHPNESGTFPLLESGGRVLDPGRGLLYGLADGLVAVSPEVARPEQLRRILQGAGGWPGGSAATNLLEAPVNAQWPAEVPLKSVVSEPDIRDLVLGVTVNESGQTEVVKADMGNLVHIAVGGSSGWGKSVFVRSLAYQLALSRTVTELVMVDLEGATLAPFARCGRLLYPVAETEREALAVFNALLDEMERRKALYAQYPGVDSLTAYNARSDEKLPPLVAVIDEATALLGDKSVESALRTLALRARKYGLWLILSGQDWKASSLDTAIRNQLSSRIQFKAMSASQSRVLLQQGGAEELDVQGRAWVVIPGKSMFQMQAPLINAQTILADVTDGGPRWSMPELVGVKGNGKKEARIRELAARGWGPASIAKEIYGSSGGSAYYKVKDVLDEING